MGSIRKAGMITSLAFFLFALSQSGSAQQWEVMTVDDGAKPTLEIGFDGIVQITYMLESHNGFVKHAVWNPLTSTFDTSLVDEGYFYGPPDLALDENNSPHINYHDHFAQDQVYSYFSGGNWINEPISSEGHDGWDNSIQIDRSGHPRTSTVDPTSSIEYAYYDGADWTVEAIGSNPVAYGNSTSLALDSTDRPHITYFDSGPLDLMYAVKDSGVWSITPIETEGDVGRYSSLAIDSEGHAHVSYLRLIAPDTGEVRYAHGNAGDWEIMTVDTLPNLFTGLANHVTSLVLDENNNPRIAYCDQSVLKYASFSGQSWVIDTVFFSPDTTLTLGQLASLQLDSLDNPHIAFYDFPSASPLEMMVRYATLSNPVSVKSQPGIPNEFELHQNYPNPFNPTTNIRFVIRDVGSVTLTVYDLLGREIATLVNQRLSPGTYTRQWDAAGQPSGVYFYRLQARHTEGGQAGSSVETKKLVLLR